MERRNILAVVAAVAVGSTGVGWYAGQQIQSPAEIAAATAAPAASLITVPIESRVLSSTVIVRGTVLFDEQTDITVSAGEGSPVVTRVPKESGQQLEEGDVVVEVSGRPVIALAGELPVFRNLTPGLTGPDVQQLEAALVRLGFDPGTVDNDYTESTEKAVEAMYRQAGYAADLPTPDTTATLDAARSRVRAAQDSVRAAEQAVAGSGVATSTKLQLDSAVTDAEQALAIAHEQAAIANAEAAALVAEALAAHEAEPTPETQSAFDLAAAQQRLTTQEQARAVAEAETQVSIAQALRQEGLAANGLESARSQVADARSELSEAQAELARIDATIGVSVPAAEIVFLPTLPRTIQTVTAKAGGGIDGSVMTVSGTGTLIDSAVSEADRKLLAVGTEAVIDDESLGISAKATVSFIADSPGGSASNDRYAIRLEPSEVLPEEAYNLSLRITIPIESTGGEVLAVPLAALSAGPDGSARVEVERAAATADEAGVTELVTVTPGLRAEGLVQITVVGGADLGAGDRVVVGRDLQLPGTDSGEFESTGTDAEADSSIEEEGG